MKKLIFLFVLVAACQPKQTPVVIPVYDTTKIIIKEVPVERAVSGYVTATEKFYMFSIEADTLTLTKANRIAAIAISTPSDATDTTLVVGNVTTIDGHATDTLKLAAGWRLSIGENMNVRIDSLTIIAKDKADIIMSPTR